MPTAAVGVYRQTQAGLLCAATSRFRLQRPFATQSPLANATVILSCAVPRGRTPTTSGKLFRLARAPWDGSFFESTINNVTAIWSTDPAGGWKLLTKAGFPLEKTLHDLVEEAPQLLPLSGSPPLAILGREVVLGRGPRTSWR